MRMEVLLVACMHGRERPRHEIHTDRRKILFKFKKKSFKFQVANVVSTEVQSSVAVEFNIRSVLM